MEAICMVALLTLRLKMSDAWLSWHYSDLEQGIRLFFKSLKHSLAVCWVYDLKVLNEARNLESDLPVTVYPRVFQDNI